MTRFFLTCCCEVDLIVASSVMARPGNEMDVWARCMDERREVCTFFFFFLFFSFLSSSFDFPPTFTHTTCATVQ